jgi:hypothetical protein
MGQKVEHIASLVTALFQHLWGLFSAIYGIDEKCCDKSDEERMLGKWGRSILELSILIVIGRS